MIRYTEYGDLTIGYEIDSDCDGNHATIIGVNGLGVDVDRETLSDMVFIAESDFSDRQYRHYLATGETL